MITSIITGDVVNSRKSQKTDEWLKELKETLSIFGKEPKDWEIYRGDSFQLEIREPERSLSAALLIKSSIKKFRQLDVRIAIGIGEKTYDAAKITESNGPVFVLSGECYENLKIKTLSIKSPWQDVNEHLNMLIDIATLTMDTWSTVTASVVKTALLNPGLTQKELASLMKKKSQSTISDSLKRAGFDEILKMEQFYENLIKSKL